MTRKKHSIRWTVLFGGLLLGNSWAQAELYTLPLFVTPTSADATTGVVRILNATDEFGSVATYAIDDAGTRFGPKTASRWRRRITESGPTGARLTAGSVKSGSGFVDFQKNCRIASIIRTWRIS